MFYITSISHFCASNKVDDEKRNAGLTTPEGIERFDDLRYGEDERNILDVYRPKDCDGKLPVIISIHGGGWVYGDKGIMQFYCMSLAERGFAVVNFSYRLAPQHKHPAMMEDINKVFCWVLENAGTYGFDTNNIFAVGDSIGATMLGLYCCLCTDPAYAEALGVRPPAGALPRAVGLNCGLYRLERGVELLIDRLAEEYLSGGGTDEEFASLGVTDRVTAAFPPSFVMTAAGDFLCPQAQPFYDRLRALGVPAEYRCYSDGEGQPTHVFHINIKLPIAQQCNDEECAFFKRYALNP
jgi:acetyl esterase/lipase